MVKNKPAKKSTKDEFMETLMEIYEAAQVDLNSKKLMANALTQINDICAAELETMDIWVR